MSVVAPPASGGSSLGEAQLRSMPFTRLVDGGMDAADARLLEAGVSAGGHWDVVAEDLAEIRLERAAHAESRGRQLTRERELRAAAATFNFAQMGLTQDTSRKAGLYERFSDAMGELARASDGYLRRIETKFGGGTLGGWLCLPRDSTRPHPAVIEWGGLSGWGATYLKSADALTRRGVACVLAEGPGQGTPRLRDGIYLREDFLSGFTALVTATLDQPELGGPVGIQGNSFGGLVAAHLAAVDSRVGACVVNGAPARPELPQFRTPREQMEAAFGTTQPDAVVGILSSLTFDPILNRIGCPLMVLQGGLDPLATSEAQAPFLAAAEPGRATQLLWEDGEHTLYNHADDRDCAVADWFAEELNRSAAT